MSLGEYIGAGSGTTKLLLHLNGNSTDSSGNGNNGTDNAITYVDGKFGKCASFNGSTSYINAGSSTDLACKTTGFTISMWLNTSNNSLAQFAYCKFTKPNENFAITYGDTGSGVLTARFYYGSSQIAASNYNANLLNNTWYHVLATYNGTSLILYLNGRIVNTLSINATPLVPDGLVNIGRRRTDSDFVPWVGLLDEIIIENRAWSAEEVAKYYTQSRGFYATL